MLVRPFHDTLSHNSSVSVWGEQLFLLPSSYVFTTVYWDCYIAEPLLKCQASEELFLSVANSDLAKSFYLLLCGLSVFLEANPPV